MRATAPSQMNTEKVEKAALDIRAMFQNLVASLFGMVKSIFESTSMIPLEYAYSSMLHHIPPLHRITILVEGAKIGRIPHVSVLAGPMLIQLIGSRGRPNRSG